MSLIGSTDYFTNAATQQLYQNIYDSSIRDAHVLRHVLGRLRPLPFFGDGEPERLLLRHDRRHSAPASCRRCGSRPAKSRSAIHSVYFGISGEEDYLVRQDDLQDPTTNHSLWRFDGAPTIRAPFSNLSFLTRDRRRRRGGSPTGARAWIRPRACRSMTPLTRQLGDFTATFVGPTFERIFQTPKSRYADRFKHVIEPNLTIDHTTPFDKATRSSRTTHSVDSIVGGDTTITYGLSNRHHGAAGDASPVPDGVARPASAKDILDVDITQSYYTNSLAANFDTQYQSSSLTTEQPAKPNPFSPLSDRTSAGRRPTRSRRSSGWSSIPNIGCCARSARAGR